MVVAGEVGVAARTARVVTTVPAARASLVGREADVAAIVDLLRRGDVRFVTITGAGGVGKTVVAEEVARRIADSDGITVQELVARDVVGGIGADAAIATLNAAEPDPVSARPHAAGRRRLVLLDGADTAPWIARAVDDALDADPDLAVLATSVTRLQSRGEHLVRLEPLPTPRRGERDPVSAGAAPAFRLFCERLEAVQPGCDLTPDRMQAICDVCALLDGLPLALELAAARCATMPLDVVAELLRGSSVLALLTAARSDPKDHHRSLRDTIAWSFELLEPSQRAIAATFGAFSGPFTIDALAAVVADSEPPVAELRPFLLADMYAIVASGMARVLPPERAGAADRFLVAAAVREFARELAAHDARHHELRNRHSAYYRDLAGTVAHLSHQFGGLAAARALLAEQENVVAALDAHVGAADPRDALAFAVALAPMWMGSGATGVGARAIEARLAASDIDGDDPLCIEAIAALSDLVAWSRNPDTHTMLRRLWDARDVACRLERDDLTLMTAHGIVQLLAAESTYDEAHHLADDAFRLATRHGHTYWRMRFLLWRAITANNQADFESALDDAIESRNLARAAGDEYQLLIATHVLAGIRGAYDDPRSELPREDDLVALAQRLGDARNEGMVRVGIAIRAVLAGDAAKAGRHLVAALGLARRTDLWFLEELSLFTLVFTGLVAGDVERSVRLHGALHEALPSLRGRLTPGAVGAYDMAIAMAAQSLGDAAFARTAASGQLLRWPDTVALGEQIAASLIRSDESAVDAVDPVDDDVALHADAPPSPLTARELDVLQLLASGCSNKEIASALQLRPKTVMHHTSNIYRKLGVRGRMEAVNEARQRGLVTGQP